MNPLQANRLIVESEALASAGSFKEAFVKLVEVVKAGVVVDPDGQPYPITATLN